MNWVLFFSILGFLASCYAVYVEKKIEKDSKYKAVCDINDKMSCTKVFTSGYGNLLGISNGIKGLIFYPIMAVLSRSNMPTLMFYIAVLSALGSVYLWYVLKYKVKTVCVVCYSIYAINVALLVASYMAM